MLTTSRCCNRVPTQFELFKLLKVVGENTVQTITPIDMDLPCGTRGLISVDITTTGETFHLFTDKVVKQGTLVITAIIVNAEGELVTFTTTAHFIATVIIPGVRPGLMDADIQHRNLLIENDLMFVNGVLTGKVHLVELIKVSVFVQRFICTTQSPTVFSRTNPTNVTTTIVCGQ